MLPLNAPLPTAWSLPFQPRSGSHTSTLMSESADGRSVNATRQAAAATVTDAPSALKEPGEISVALAIVAFATCREVIDAHRFESCAEAVSATAAQAALATSVRTIG